MEYIIDDDVQIHTGSDNIYSVPTLVFYQDRCELQCEIKLSNLLYILLLWSGF